MCTWFLRVCTFGKEKPVREMGKQKESTKEAGSDKLLALYTGYSRMFTLQSCPTIPLWGKKWDYDTPCTSAVVLVGHCLLPTNPKWEIRDWEAEWIAQMSLGTTAPIYSKQLWNKCMGWQKVHTNGLYYNARHLTYINFLLFWNNFKLIEKLKI